MGRKAKVFWGPWAVVTMAGACMLLVGSVGVDAGAHAVSASQPVVVAPVAAGGVWEWFAANSGWIVPLVLSFLASLATGLSEYPKAAGVVKVLRIFVAWFSVVQFKNAPGSLKAPLVPPAKG